MSKRNTKHSRRVKGSGCRTGPMVVDCQNGAQIAEFFGAHGLALMPLAQMLSECKVKLNDLLADTGRALIEWLLTLSAQSVAGPKSQGREVEREVVWHGRQAGRVELLERQRQLLRPRLRTKGPQAREVAIPAYEAIRRDPQAAARMSEILLAGVSTRRYATVLPKMAKTVGVSRSRLSRKLIAAGASCWRNSGRGVWRHWTFWRYTSTASSLPAEPWWWRSAWPPAARNICWDSRSGRPRTPRW